LQGIQGGSQGITRGRRHRFNRPFYPRWLGNQRGNRRFDGQVGHIEPEGPGSVEDFGSHKPEFGPPYRGIDEKNESAAFDIGQPRMRDELLGQTGTQPQVPCVKPQGTTQRIASRTRKQRIERGLGCRKAVVAGSGTGHAGYHCKRKGGSGGRVNQQGQCSDMANFFRSSVFKKRNKSIGSFFATGVLQR